MFQNMEETVAGGKGFCLYTQEPVSTHQWKQIFRIASSSSFRGKFSVFGIFLEISDPSVPLQCENGRFRLGLWTKKKISQLSGKGEHLHFSFTLEKPES